MPRKYNWIEEFDECDNSIWVLTSPYEEGFKFRLEQIIMDNKIEWQEAHDAELCGIPSPLSWPDLKDAKADIEQCCRNILEDNSI